MRSTSASKFNKSMADELEFNLPSFKVLAHVACTVVAILGGVSVLVFLELRMIDRAHLRNPEIVDYATAAASWGAVSTSSVIVGAGLSVRGCAGGPVVAQAALLEAASVDIAERLRLSLRSARAQPLSMTAKRHVYTVTDFSHSFPATTLEKSVDGDELLLLSRGVECGLW